MMVDKLSIWAEWTESVSKHYHELFGGFVLDFDVALRSHDNKPDKPLGMAKVHITDESWSVLKKDETLVQLIHECYNDELNYNHPTDTEYLEDALNTVNYGNGSIQGTVAVLHRIEIYQDYRGQNLFEFYMNSIIQQCKKLKVDHLILLPCPFGLAPIEIEEKQRRKELLENFYAKLGFVEIPTTYKSPYWALTIKSRNEEKKNGKELNLCN